jgi:predicted double-glycine peptidase
VLAYVRLGMKPEGVSHVVAVTGMSGKEVTVVDPWDAAEKTYPVEQFKASWDTDFGQGRHRNYLAIRPRETPQQREVPPWRARGRTR